MSASSRILAKWDLPGIFDNLAQRLIGARGVSYTEWLGDGQQLEAIEGQAGAGPDDRVHPLLQVQGQGQDAAGVLADGHSSAGETRRKGYLSASPPHCRQRLATLATKTGRGQSGGLLYEVTSMT